MKKYFVLFAVALFYFTTSIDKIDGGARTRAMLFESMEVCTSYRAEAVRVLQRRYEAGQIAHWRVSRPCLRIEIIRDI